MKKRTILSTAILCLLFTAYAYAGVTIHYEGTAKSIDDIDQIILIVKQFAFTKGWAVEDASASKGKLDWIINEKDVPYEGKISGVTLKINSKCEPVIIQFGDNLFMQDFVKTQFAGPDTHIQIIEMLDAIKPYFQSLNVNDEGEYWESHDKEVLRKHFSRTIEVMNDMKKKNPKLTGPHLTSSGRIIDLMDPDDAQNDL